MWFHVSELFSYPDWFWRGLGHWGSDNRGSTVHEPLTDAKAKGGVSGCGGWGGVSG